MSDPLQGREWLREYTVGDVITLDGELLVIVGVYNGGETYVMQKHGPEDCAANAKPARPQSADYRL